MLGHPITSESERLDVLDGVPRNAERVGHTTAFAHRDEIKQRKLGVIQTGHKVGRLALRGSLTAIGPPQYATNAT